MSNTSEWVAHNLEKQRQLIEEKQRQKRTEDGSATAAQIAAARRDSATLVEAWITGSALYPAVGRRPSATNVPTGGSPSIDSSTARLLSAISASSTRTPSATTTNNQPTAMTKSSTNITISRGIKSSSISSQGFSSAGLMMDPSREPNSMRNSIDTPNGNPTLANGKLMLLSNTASTYITSPSPTHQPRGGVARTGVSTTPPVAPFPNEPQYITLKGVTPPMGRRSPAPFATVGQASAPNGEVVLGPKAVGADLATRPPPPFPSSLGHVYSSTTTKHVPEKPVVRVNKPLEQMNSATFSEVSTNPYDLQQLKALTITASDAMSPSLLDNFHNHKSSDDTLSHSRGGLTSSIANGNCKQSQQGPQAEKGEVVSQQVAGSLWKDEHNRGEQPSTTKPEARQLQRRGTGTSTNYVESEEDSNPATEVLEGEPARQPALLDIITNLDSFVMEPTRKSLTLRCLITRDKKGMEKGVFPIYYLHMEKADGRRVFLLAARRRKKSINANYLLSTDPTDLRREGKSFVAKVRSNNALGTMFTIYDNGENPKRAAVIGDNVRRELASVIYETNVFGLKGPRRMTIIIPAIYVDDKINYCKPVVVRPISERDSIVERYKSHRLDEMVVLSNKDPMWCDETQSYVLNFHGRVTQASVKNFQIVHYDPTTATCNLDYIIMQFGRVDSETFSMDIRYPLSPVQAFGIAMTSFHGKLACE